MPPILVTEVCWASSQPDQNLRGPHVTRQQQISIDICCPRLTSAANRPAIGAAVDRWDRRKDGRTDIRPYCDAATACYADVNKFRSASLTGTWWPFWRRWSAVHEDAELVTLAVSSASVPLGSAPSPGRCPFDGRGLSDDRRDGGSSSGWIAMMVRYLAIGVSGGLAAATSNPPWRPLARISTRKRRTPRRIHRDVYASDAINIGWQ